MEFNGLLDIIESNDIITIFRHENPDCDACGSQFGLQNWIQENYPNKQVYVLGNQVCDQAQWPKNDIVSEQTINNSLAIVVDCANAPRVDDQRFLNAKQIVKIDHHPDHEPYGNLVYVDDSAAAVCQILTFFFHENETKIFSKKTAEYLYRGLLTDSLNYTTSNTTPQTLEAGGILASKGLDLSKISHDVFDNSVSGYQFTGYIISHTKVINGHFAYVVIPEKDYMEYGFDASKARSFVGKLGNVKDFDIWAIFTEKIVDDVVLFDGSLRAKQTQINDIAEKYHGGGHACAAGVKNLNKENLNKIIQLLCERL